MSTDKNTTEKINLIIKECYNDYNIPNGDIFKSIHDINRGRCGESDFLDFLINHHNPLMPPIPMEIMPLHIPNMKSVNKEVSARITGEIFTWQKAPIWLDTKTGHVWIMN